MKTKKECPKCKGTTIYYIEKVAANEETGTLQEQPCFRLAVTGKGINGRTGNLEAYAYADCGYAEFYLKDIPQPDGKYIKEI